MCALTGKFNMFKLGLTLSITLALLTGCSTVRLIDSQVQSVNAQGAVSLQGAHYRFERLPSQINNPAAGLAEQQAQVALSTAGLVRDDPGAQLSIQVHARATTFMVDPWGRPVYGLGMNSYWGRGIGFNWGMRFPPPNQYQYEVSLLMRNLRSGQVVYETQATHSGPWSDSEIIFPALMSAALKDFPNPPAKTRQVNIEIPR
jgi:hypothetical protein